MSGIKEVRMKEAQRPGRSGAPSDEPESRSEVRWIERFETLEQLHTAVRAFGRTYNESWLIERHRFRTPIEAREHLIRQAGMA